MENERLRIRTIDPVATDPGSDRDKYMGESPLDSNKETLMTTDNIFSGVKVVDLASFIAGPGAAVILSDFGADVIKVEPPTGDLWRIGYKVPASEQSQQAGTGSRSEIG